LSDHVTVVSSGFRTALIERGVPSEKISVIHNWCDESQLLNADAATMHHWPGKFIVAFAGTMGPAQAIDSVLEAARLLSARRPDVHFLFIGGGTETDRLKARAASLALTNVTFAPWVPMGEIRATLERADALLVHLKDDPLFRITIPSKAQAYMALGRPILMAVRGEAEQLVRDAECGVTCAPENPSQLAAAVETMADMDLEALKKLGNNGRAYYFAKSSLRVGAQQFDRVFQSLAAPQAGSADAVCSSRL
jgi:glycosyltransferase involved in cell wall biosynthesis